MSVDQMVALAAAQRISLVYESGSPFVTLTKDSWINALAKAWLEGVDKGIAMAKAEAASKKRKAKS